jgi:hypothetical protein
MLTIHAVAETSAAPEAVIAAARDFTERRATIWPNVRAGHFEVHACGETFVEATEYLWPLGVWERCRYEWPAPDRVLATVLDSNVLAPDSTWELTAIAIEGGTRVEAVFHRDFRRGVRGRIAKAVNHLAQRLFSSSLRQALIHIEEQSV